MRFKRQSKNSNKCTAEYLGKPACFEKYIYYAVKYKKIKLSAKK